MVFDEEQVYTNYMLKLGVFFSAQFFGRVIVFLLLGDGFWKSSEFWRKNLEEKLVELDEVDESFFFIGRF